MGSLIVEVTREPHARDLPLPEYATEGAAGLDLLAAVESPVTLRPGERKLIPTGIRIALPEGMEGQVRARSGLALSQGLGMVNAPGTIDSDYRGEIKVILINWSEEPRTIRRGDRVAQLIISPVLRIDLVETDCLGETDRGDGGFGHTG